MSSLAARLVTLAAFVLVIAVVASVRLEANTSVLVQRAENQPGVAVVMRVNFGASSMASSALANLKASWIDRSKGITPAANDIAVAPDEPRSTPKCGVC